MIDKLDARVPAQTGFAPQMQIPAGKLRFGKQGPFRPARFYRYVSDLRETNGIDAIVHLENRTTGDHKIEVVDAGKKSLPEMRETIASVFRVDPRELEVMRIDLAADVPDVPVSWFRNHAQFQFKRFCSQIEKAEESELEFMGMGSADTQSIYAGRRPNCVRIYDKIAEWRRQWLKLCRKLKKFNDGLVNFDLTETQIQDATQKIPTFPEFCEAEGYEFVEGAILTRVERQFGGDRIPPRLATIKQLENVADFNPFDTLRIIGSSGPRKIADPASISIRDWLAARGLQAVIDDLGSTQTAMSFIRKHGKGNGRRVIDSLMPHLGEEHPGITPENIYELCKQSTAIQLAKKVPADLYFPPKYVEENQVAAGSA